MPDPSLERFRKVVANACAELESRRQEVNDLNVFPVADGDTGDNMAMTMRAVLDELDRLDGQMIDDIGRDELVSAVARAALLGARGNSGVILSQIVRGAAEELASRPGELVDPVLVAAAFARAADAAYESVRDPAEGTMLSAVRAMAHRVAHDLAHMEKVRLEQDATDAEQDELLADVLERALEAASEAVERGPEQLPVLKEAGVVDAGRLRADGDRRRRDRCAARRRRPAARTPDGAGAGGHAPAPARVERVPLLHELRRHRLRPRRARVHPPARGDRRLRAGRRRPGDAEGARPHRRARPRHVDVHPVRRGVALRRGRHARAGRRTGRARLEAACSPVVVATGDGLVQLFRELGAQVVDGGPDDEPVDLRHPRGRPRRAWRALRWSCRTART